jgi:hypothetical protein
MTFWKKNLETEGRWSNISGLLATIAMSLGSVWSTDSDLPTKIALTLTTMAGLCLSVSKLAEVEHMVMSVLAIALPIVTIFVIHVRPGTALAVVMTNVIAILTSLQKAIGPSAKPTITPDA